MTSRYFDNFIPWRWSKNQWIVFLSAGWATTTLWTALALGMECSQ